MRGMPAGRDSSPFKLVMFGDGLSPPPQVIHQAHSWQCGMHLHTAFVNEALWVSRDILRSPAHMVLHKKQGPCVLSRF